jgi:hypothetical protein
LSRLNRSEDNIRDKEFKRKRSLKNKFSWKKKKISEFGNKMRKIRRDTILETLVIEINQLR